MNVPSEIIALLQRQAAALARVAPKHRARLRAIARRVQADLRLRLAGLGPARFSAQEARVLLAQVQVVVDGLGARWGEEIGAEMEAIGREAAGIGRTSLIRQIDVWSSEYAGSIRRIGAVDLASDLLDDGLLEYYRVSRETYGMGAIRRMRDTLARGQLQGETTARLTQRLADDVAIEQYRAERIVRTEQSFALHRRQLLDVREGYGAEADELWRKQLLATFDSRTGEDSKYVHEQMRRLDEPFRDNEGRVYMHPPNRPNDREAMVLVPAGLEDILDGL